MDHWITLLGTVSAEEQVWETLEQICLAENELHYSVLHIRTIAAYSWR